MEKELSKTQEEILVCANVIPEQGIEGILNGVGLKLKDKTIQELLKIEGRKKEQAVEEYQAELKLKIEKLKFSDKDLSMTENLPTNYFNEALIKVLSLISPNKE